MAGMICIVAGDREAISDRLLERLKEEHGKDLIIISPEQAAQHEIDSIKSTIHTFKIKPFLPDPLEFARIDKNPKPWYHQFDKKKKKRKK